MTNKTLRFRARGTALVQNLQKLEANIKSYIGRKFVEPSPGTYGFEPTNAAEEVAYTTEYVKACKDGDLWPADEETAAACGVDFDPAFGAADEAEKD